MKHLIIIGARGWGREVYAAFKTSKEVLSAEMDIKGFLDSKADAFDGLRGTYPPILGPVEDYIIQPDDIFFVALGDPHWRKHYAEIIDAKGGSFHTYISDKAAVCETARIGEGSFISNWSSVSDNDTLGKHVILHSFASIGHDVIVKDYGTLLSYVFLGGHAEVGECSLMNPKSMIISNKKIGNNVTVGSASVVIRNVPDGISVYGNPAKKMEF